MFEKNLLANKRILVTGGGSGLGAAMGRRFVELGAELVICGRRAGTAGNDGGPAARRPRRQSQRDSRDIRNGADVDAMMETIWRDGPLDILVNNAAATFIAQTELSVVSRRGRDPGADAAWYDVLHAGVPASAGSTAGSRARCEHPVDLDHYRPALHGAFGDGEVGYSGDDQKPRGGMGTPGHSHRGDCARCVSDPGRLGPAGRPGKAATTDKHLKNPLGCVGEHRRACRSCKFPDLGSAPVTSTARWWCRMAARTCAAPAPRICCNGPMRSGRKQRGARPKGLRPVTPPRRDCRFGDFPMSVGRP